MITKLKFQNWRSLRDVTIDNLTPITVFIGANSSGKTNILDWLYFLREALDRDVWEALENRGGYDDIHTVSDEDNEPVLVGTWFRPYRTSETLTYELYLEEKQNRGLVGNILFPAPYNFSERLSQSGKKLMTTNEGGVEIFDEDGNIQHKSRTSELGLSALGRTDTYPYIQQAFEYITQRWQLLRENFMPILNIPLPRTGGTYTSSYLVPRIRPDAENTVLILQAMQQFDLQRKDEDKLYPQLVADMSRLLEHVGDIEVLANDLEIETVIHEKPLGGKRGPTSSAGTARIFAMLTAYYALDMRTPEQPGLVVIEEPDTAIHPLLLGKLVDLLRSYTERDVPRQFILTTHNPEMLNYFEPEEVRIVERDEDTGETWVEKVPDYLREIWLEKHRLGDAWMSRIIGGIPE